MKQICNFRFMLIRVSEGTNNKAQKKKIPSGLWQIQRANDQQDPPNAALEEKICIKQLMKALDLARYSGILRRIIWLTILQYKYVTVAAVLCVLLALSSSYFTVRTADYITGIASSSSTAEAAEYIKWFLYCSTIALTLRYLPKLIYTAILQEICRRQFVHYLSEYMALDYPSFHKRIPGEMRYSIFLKSYASVMCSQVIVFEGPIVLGTTIFSVMGIYSEISIITALVFAVIPFIYLIAVLYSIRIGFWYQNRFLLEQGNTSATLYDKLLNYEVIKAYNLEESETKLLESALGHQVETQVDLGKFNAKNKLCLSFLLVVPYISIVLCILFGLDSSTSTNLFKTTVLYATLSAHLKRMGEEITNLMMYLNQIDFAEVDSKKIEGGEETATFNSRIEFRDVTLYHDSTPVVSGINAVIHRGEKIAVVGTNGTGKSTLVKALLGFTRFTGSILFDGVPTTSLSWPSIRRLISYIPQDDYTSDDTVIGNLRLGAPDAPREQIEEVARMYGAHETFSGLERGYDTEAGPRGNRLSGGQRQRMSLVRAAVRDAGMFVMDEATASMDKQYEQQVVGMLFRNLREKTLVMIVHGGEHLERFDRVFFMNEGRLEDTGHFRELLDRSENFRMMMEQ